MLNRNFIFLFADNGEDHHSSTVGANGRGGSIGNNIGGILAMGHHPTTTTAMPLSSASSTTTLSTGVTAASVSAAPNTMGPTGGLRECAGCRKRITERFLLKALDVFWHEDCLKCGCCDCRLGEVGSTLYNRANLILCKRDYLRYVTCCTYHTYGLA